MSGETAKFPKSLLKLQLHAGMVGEDGGEDIWQIQIKPI